MSRWHGARRLLARTLALLLAGIALIGATGFWLLGTEGGARWAWTVARALVPGTLRAEAVEGRLLGPFSLRDLRWHDSRGRSLAVREAGWRLELGALGQGVLRIAEVHARGIRYRHVPDGQPAAFPPALPERLGLPLPIELRRLEVRDVEIETGGARPVRVDHISASARADRRLKLHHLDVRSPEGWVHLAGEARLHSPYPYTVRLQWRGRPSGPALDGSARIEGDRYRLRVTARNTAPLAVRLEGSADLTPPFPFEATLSWAGLRWPVAGRTRLHCPTGSIRATGTPSDWRVRAEARVVLPDPTTQAPVHLTLAAAGGLRQAKLEKLEALAGAGRLELSGRLRWATGLDWRIEGHTETLDLAAFGSAGTRLDSGRLESHGGWDGGRLDASLRILDVRLQHADRVWLLHGARAHVQGPLEDIRGTLALQGASEGLPPLDLKARVRLTASRAELLELKARVLDGTVQGWGAAVLDGDHPWRLTLEARGLDPGALTTDWAGTLDVEARLSGALPRDGPQVRMESLRLHGVVQDRPLALQAAGRWDGRTLAVESMSLESADNRLRAQGRLGPRTLELELDLDLARLERLWPGLAGHLAGRARLAGSPRDPRGRVDLEGGALVWQETAGLSRMVLRARLGGAAGPSSLDLEAEDLRIGDRRWTSLDLRAHGTPQHHRAALRATGDPGMLLELAGAWNRDHWAGRVERLELSNPALGSWKLAAPAGLEVGPDRFALDPACLKREPARICLEAQGVGMDTWRLAAGIEALPLEWMADPVLGERARAEGRLEARLEAAAHRPLPRLEFTARLPGAALVVPLAGEEPLRLPLDEAEARLVSDGRRARLRLRAHGPILHLEAQGEAAGLDGASPTSGRLAFAMEEVGFLQALVPDINLHGGRLRGQGRWDGTLARPRPEGVLRLTGLDLEIADLGIRLEEGEIQARATARRVALAGRLRSGEGTLNLEGDLIPETDAGWPYTLRLEGKAVEFIRTAEIHAIASPDLRLRGDVRSLEVTGRIELPVTVVELGELPPGTVKVSEDQEVVGEPEPEAPRAPLDARVDVLVVLGDGVRFKGLGLETRLDGSLRVLQEPGRALRGEGVLSFKTGTYKIYGVELELERGRLLFAGRIDNPSLDFRATRRIGDVTVGVEMSGTVENPVTHLFSSPAMDDANILAYLIRGKPLSEAGDVDKEAMLAAALSMGLGPVTDRLAKQLGVDLTLDTGSDVDDTRLGIGRRINPKLYVEYVVGLFDRTGLFKLTYKLTRHLELVTETGQQQAVDIKYRIESDSWPFTRNSPSKSSTSTTPE